MTGHRSSSSRHSGIYEYECLEPASRDTVDSPSLFGYSQQMCTFSNLLILYLGFPWPQ